jgi:selenocysteine lyase/cysteine desulfurase
MHLDGVVLKTFEPALTADGNLNRINDLITAKTKVIAVPHITCTTGLKLPIKEISALGKAKGLWVFIDGAHGPGSTYLDVKEMGCDFYAGCCHKWLLGPKGTGFVYIREELLDTVQARWIGSLSDMGWDFRPSTPTFEGYVDSAHRYYFGTQNSALYAGVESAVEFMEMIGMKKIEKRTRDLSFYLQNRLAEMPDRVEILTPSEEKSHGPMMSFRLKGFDFNQFFKDANSRERKNPIRVRAVPEAGLDCIRISTHIFNSYKEVDTLIGFIEDYE